MNLSHIVPARSDEQFKEIVSYFANKGLMQERLEQYEAFAKINMCTTEQAKDSILKAFLSEYIQASIRSSLELAANNDTTAFQIIETLEELRPVFKDYDVNSFASFISSVEKTLSETNAELLFCDGIVSNEFVDVLTSNIIKSLGSPPNRPCTPEEFVASFNNHPLLYCLQEESDIDKVLMHIEDGTLDVGRYKQLITMVLGIKRNKNDEDIDFFISYLIKEDITKGFYSINKEDGYKPWALKDLLTKITKGEPLTKFDIEYAIENTNEYKVTLFTDADGKLKKTNSSKKTLNDSGFDIKFDDVSFFCHLHTAQGKGENQQGQQATTTAVCSANNMDSVSFTLLKKNAGRNGSHLDVCKTYDIELSDMEKIFLSNLQFEADMFKALWSTFKEKDLTSSRYLSNNLRLVKDSIASSVEYNKMHLGLNDAEVIRGKAQLLVEFIENHFVQLEKLKSNTDSQMSVQSQVIAVPILNACKYLLNLEKRVGVVFGEKQIATIKNFIKKESTSIQINDLQLELEEKTSIPVKRGVTTKVTTFNTSPASAEAGFTVGMRSADEIRAILLFRHGGAQLNETLSKLDDGDLVFNNNYYTKSDRVDYYIASRMRETNTNGKMKVGSTYDNHIEALNLLCEYARINGRKIKTGSVDYTNGFKRKTV